MGSFLSEMETKKGFSIEMKEWSLVGSMQDTPGYTASEQWIQGLTWGPLLFSVCHTLLGMVAVPTSQTREAAKSAELWRGPHSQVYASASHI